MKRIFTFSLTGLNIQTSDLSDSETQPWIDNCQTNELWGRNVETILSPEVVSTLPPQAASQGEAFDQVITPAYERDVISKKTQYLVDGQWLDEVPEGVEYEDTQEVDFVSGTEIVPAVTQPMVKFPAEYVYWVVDITAEIEAKRKAEENKEIREFLFGIIDTLKDANTAAGITSEQTLAFVNDARISNCMRLILANSFKALYDYVVATDFTGLFNESQKAYVVSALSTFAASKGIQL